MVGNKKAGYEYLLASLKQKHMREGGLSEALYRKRIDYRKNNYE